VTNFEDFFLRKTQQKKSGGHFRKSDALARAAVKQYWFSRKTEAAELCQICLPYAKYAFANLPCSAAFFHEKTASHLKKRWNLSMFAGCDDEEYLTVFRGCCLHKMPKYAF